MSKSEKEIFEFFSNLYENLTTSTNGYIRIKKTEITDDYTITFMNKNPTNGYTGGMKCLVKHKEDAIKIAHMLASHNNLDIKYISSMEVEEYIQERHNNE